MHAISKEYDRKRVEVLLNTAESLLIDELDTEKIMIIYENYVVILTEIGSI